MSVHSTRQRHISHAYNCRETRNRMMLMQYCGSIIIFQSFSTKVVALRLPSARRTSRQTTIVLPNANESSRSTITGRIRSLRSADFARLQLLGTVTVQRAGATLSAPAAACTCNTAYTFEQRCECMLLCIVPVTSSYHEPELLAHLLENTAVPQAVLVRIACHLG